MKRNLILFSLLFFTFTVFAETSMFPIDITFEVFGKRGSNCSFFKYEKSELRLGRGLSIFLRDIDSSAKGACSQLIDWKYNSPFNSHYWPGNVLFPRIRR